MSTEPSNPLVVQRADPWVLRHDGEYYFTASHPLYDRIVLRRAAELDDLQEAEEVTIWEPPSAGPSSHLVWAPELHRVGGAWYVYFAAAPDGQGAVDAPGASETFNHRIFVLENTSPDPFLGEWVERGQVDTGWESFALDATSTVIDGRQHLVWAQQDLTVPGHSNIYIARMKNPWTLATPAVELTRPEHAWERRGFWVNEGPAVLQLGDGVVLTYSGAATGVDYAMGVLTAARGSDLLDPASWTKAPEPVMVSDPAAGVYGPGHNSFTELADGTPVLVYHARPSADVEGDPLWDPNRHARAQILEVGADGTPVWGPPVPDVRPVPVGTRVLGPSGW